MAFEAFRALSDAPARSGRRSLWYGLSIAVHGAVITVGVAYSFWHVEELSPPLLRVTFMSAAPPPPPAAAPPAGGGTAPKKKAIVKPKAIVEPKNEIVQPKEVPKEEPKEEPKADDHGEKDGVKGGVAGGTPGGIAGGTPGGKVGGTPGGTGDKPGPAKFLTPNVGEGQRLSCDKGNMPVQLRKPGAVYRILLKVCVSTLGNVDKLTLMKGTDPLADEEALRVIRTCRYRPFMVNGTPAPFCYPQIVEFKTE